MDDLNTEIKIGADASGVEAGVGRAKRSLSDLGVAAKKASKDAADGVGGIGTSGDKAAREVDRATKSMQGSLQRLLAEQKAGTRGSREYWEALAATRGINRNAITPLLDQLDAAKVKTKSAQAATESWTASLGSVGPLIAGAFAGAAVLNFAGAAVRAADAVTVLNNQLKLATGSTSAAGQAYEALFDIAQRSRVSFTELGSTYASIARAGESLGLSQQRLLGVTEAIGNAMTISGGSAAGMQAALTQLGQGLASGTLRGEELNSVMEQTPRLARAIADGLGVTTGQLRAMGAAGQLTGEQVIKALEGQAATLRGEVAGATLTVGQAMTQLQNATIKTVGEFDKASGASAALAGGISELAGVVSAMGRAFAENETAIKTTLGVLAGVGTAAAIARTATALGGLATGVGGVAGAVGALKLAMAANPFGLLAIGIGAATGALIAYNSAQAGTASGMRKTITDLESANNGLLNLKGQAGMSAAERAGYEERLKAITALKAQLAEFDRTLAAKNAPTGSVGSGDTALLRAQNADRATRQAALAKMMGELATPTEKLNKALADAKKSLGDLYSPEIEARITAKYTKPTQAAAVATDELAAAAERGAKAVAAMAAKDAGLSPEFMNSWADLSAAFEKGRINLDQLTAAQAALLAQQPAMVAAAQAQAQAAEQLAAAEADRINALERSAGSAAERLQQMQAEERASALAAAQNISLAQAIEEVAIARLREQQAALMREGNRDAEVLALQSEIDARKQIASAIGSKEARAASEQSAKDAAADWSRTAQRIEQDLTDALMRGFESGKDFAANLKDTLVNMFKTMVLRPIIQAIVTPVAGTLTGALGFSGSANAAGGGGSVGDILSTLQSGFSALNGTVSNTIGTAFSKFAGSSAGQSMGLSNTGYMAGNMGPVAPGGQLTSMGSTMGTALGVVGNTLAGYAMGSMARSLISNGYSAGKGMDNFQKVGIAVGSAIGGPIVGALIGAGAGVFNQLFGRKLKDQGVQGEFSDQGFSGENFQFLKGGVFRSNKTKTSALDPALDSGLDQQFAALRNGAAGMAEVLGIGASALDGFTKAVKISFNGLNEQQIQERLAEVFGGIANDLAQRVLDASGSAQPVIREGESASEALTRLAGSLVTVNTAFDSLGTTLLSASLQSADLASSLIDAFGGAEQFAAATQSYYANFYTDAEKLDTAARQLGATFEGLGITLPATKEAFRQLVEAQDLTTESGRGTYAALLSLSGAFAEVTGAAEQAALAAAKAAADAAAKASAAAFAHLEHQAGEYFNRRDRMQAEQDYTVQGADALSKFFGSAAASASDAAAQTAQASVDAAQATAQAWRSAVQSMQSALESLHAGTVDQMDPGARYAVTKATLNAYTDAALGGDVDAAGKLSTAAADFLRASESGSASQAQYLRDRAFAQAQLSRVIDSSQAQASVQDAIAASGSAAVAQLEAMNANLSGFAATLLELLNGQYQGADRGTAEAVASTFGRMQADFDAYFRDFQTGSVFADGSFNGASFTRLSGDGAAFAGADGSISYLRATDSILDIAKRVPELRELWEQAYGLKLPSFAVGTNFVPRDMVAQIHKGEAIIPAAYNPAAGGQQAGNTERLERLVEGLTAEVQRLQSVVREGNENTRQLADQFDNVTEGGNATRTVSV